MMYESQEKGFLIVQSPGLLTKKNIKKKQQQQNKQTNKKTYGAVVEGTRIKIPEKFPFISLSFIIQS